MPLIAVATNLAATTQTIMSKAAVDTNIMLYALDNFYPVKQAIAIDLISDCPYFCSQNLSEFANVCLRRWKFPKEKVADILTNYLRQCNYVAVSEQMIFSAAEIMKLHHFQFFDSIIISAALASNCSILYSEDMSDGQVIQNKLRIVNPFK
jgi:predicted nucleic acid-binding protein